MSVSFETLPRAAESNVVAMTLTVHTGMQQKDKQDICGLSVLLQLKGCVV